MRALDLLLKTASYEEGLLAKIAAKKGKKGPAKKRNKGTLIRDTDTAYVGNAEEVKKMLKKEPEFWGGAKFPETPKTTEKPNWGNFKGNMYYTVKETPKMKKNETKTLKRIKTGAKVVGALGLLGGLGYAGYNALQNNDKAS